MAQVDVSYSALKQMIAASGSFVAYVPIPIVGGYDIYITRHGRDWHAVAAAGSPAEDFEAGLKAGAKQAADADEAIGFADFGVTP